MEEEVCRECWRDFLGQHTGSRTKPLLQVSQDVALEKGCPWSDTSEGHHLWKCLLGANIISFHPNHHATVDGRYCRTPHFTGEETKT